MPWIGPEIRKERRRLGLTGPEFAKRVGASPRSVYAWERAEAEPQMHWQARISDILGPPPEPEPPEAPGPDPAPPTPSAEMEQVARSLPNPVLLAELTRRFGYIPPEAVAPAPDSGRSRLPRRFGPGKTGETEQAGDANATDSDLHEA